MSLIPPDEPESAATPAPPDVPGAPTDAIEAAPESPRYGSMGARLLAYVLDLVVWVALMFWIGFALDRAGVHVLEHPWLASLLGIGLQIGLFVVSEAAFRTTLGKLALGLRLEGEPPADGGRMLIRVLLRETLGRVVNGFAWGLGYWLALAHPRRQSLGDRLARTTVVVAAVPRGRRLIAAAALVVAFGTAIAAMANLPSGLNWHSRGERIAQVLSAIDSANVEIHEARLKIDTLYTRPVATVEDYRADMRDVLPWLEIYDRGARHSHELVRHSLREHLFSGEDRRQLEILDTLWGMRLAQSAKRSEVAKLVLTHDEEKESFETMQRMVGFLNSDIEALSRSADRYMHALRDS